jgi:L-ascorbate metabolism protein UlaG (beta-lactamase superfamily)
MKKIFSKSITRYLMISIGIIIFVLSIVILTLSCSPQFGGSMSENKLKSYSSSSNFHDGKFINKDGVDVSVKISFSDFIKNIPMMFQAQDTATVPSQDLPMIKIDKPSINSKDGITQVYWFGHSSLFIQIEGKNILLDPVFSMRAAPFSWIGPKRFSSSLPISLENLPEIDAVVISHDHYDHLDYEAILKLKDKTKMFFTPLGVGIHLKRWGVDENKIIELDWWQEINTGDLKFIATPALHTSGRKPNTTASTLWASWVIKSKTESIFFSGDGGYEEHFKAIGEKFGPFNIAFMECGQYNEMWPKLHMFPEQTIQASIDIQAKLVLPIHWGAFTISEHSWTDPIERFTKAANKKNIPVIIPKIGEAIIINDSLQSTPRQWWKTIK